MSDEYKGDLVDTMLAALLDRGGFDEWWYGIDNETQAGIVTKLRGIVARHREVAAPPDIEAKTVEKIVTWIWHRSQGGRVVIRDAVVMQQLAEDIRSGAWRKS